MKEARHVHSDIDGNEDSDEHVLRRVDQKADEFLKAYVFAKAKVFISHELHNPNLSSQRVALGIGVSRAVLYRAFTHAGGVKRFVDGERLARAFETLESRYNEPGIVASTGRSCGYENKVRFSRLYLARFNETPTAFVRRMRQGGIERG